MADPQNEESVPEPAAILGLVAVGGVLVAKRKQQAA
ncbi:MAG: PEP-CTERM sorting domain-containing protein [Cyanobacteria bacterium P01_D01_bin.128]